MPDVKEASKFRHAVSVNLLVTTSVPAKTYTETGHTLSFFFVCQYGNGTTFGKDKTIFECVANDWHTHGAGGE